jgi:hypothetical protein
LGKVRTRRRILTKAKFSATIVISMYTLLMNVCSRRSKYSSWR